MKGVGLEQECVEHKVGRLISYDWASDVGHLGGRMKPYCASTIVGGGWFTRKGMPRATAIRDVRPQAWLARGSRARRSMAKSG